MSTLNKVSSLPVVTGQCAQVLAILRSCQSILSFELTADMAIPQAAARIYDLRAKGFHISTHIEPKIIFRGVARYRVARYRLHTPEWPAPGYLDETS